MLKKEEKIWKVNMNLGELTIIATPIGNLSDISQRALNKLKSVDYILCEDTRVTKKLLDYYSIIIPTISYHHHSGLAKVDKIKELLKGGKNLALVSDAGTPGISDPGGNLIKELRKKFNNKLNIKAIPGPSALITALSVSGFNTDRFLFLGFLPHKKGRQTMLKEIGDSKYTVALFESKHRIIKLLQELINLEINDIFIAREITKIYENYYWGTPQEILKFIQVNSEHTKGEFVVVINKK